MANPRRRRCKICREWFHPKYENIEWCSPEHGAELAIKRRSKEREKLEAKLKKEQKLKEVKARDKLKARKLAVKPTSYFKQQAQAAFNQFIRLRDRHEPCISCGESNPPDLHGGQWDCGHFLSVGSHPELRFDERNAYKQCKSCNAGAGKYSQKNATVSQKYEQRLIERFGQCLIDWLRGPHELPHWKREDYIRIRDEYRAKVKEIKKNE
ncbi:recombination protein NinG [Providencia rettgeri]|uniref:recombination protein NinG n=1 Tax=Providencia rettgeri TaxID=587 RepID=UPI001BA6520C|nr:recombination protein NinG [Providencia rettgeri]MBS0918242.1 recombination protein NinG [Providencia rettgeri]